MIERGRVSMLLGAGGCGGEGGPRDSHLPPAWPGEHKPSNMLMLGIEPMPQW